MKTIHKYPIPIQDRQTVMMPGGGGRILHVAMQNGSLTLWVEVDTDLPDAARKVSIVGTGHPLDHVAGMPHVGSAIVGLYVWHVYSNRH